MDPPDTWQGFKLGTPANYRIRVQGDLDATWSERLKGMAIMSDKSAKPSVTILEGHVADQAALSGVLNTLYELRLSLLSVENLDEKYPGIGIKKISKLIRRTTMKRLSITALVLAGSMIFCLAAMAAEKIDIPSEVTLFKDINIFDGTNEQLMEDYDVLVVRNKIHKVAKDL